MCSYFTSSAHETVSCGGLKKYRFLNGLENVEQKVILFGMRRHVRLYACI